MVPETRIRWYLFFSAGLVSVGKRSWIYSIRLKNITRKLIPAMGIVGVSAFIWYQYNQLQAYTDWKQAYKMLHSGNKEMAFLHYSNLLPRLKHDQFFMYNYGAELSQAGQYEHSIKILNQTKTMINDVDVYTHLGNSYEALGRYDKSIKAFEQAMWGFPNKFYPKYRLVPLYYGTGQEQKSIALARKIVNMKPKIPSQKVKRMKKETREFLMVYGKWTFTG